MARWWTKPPIIVAALGVLAVIVPPPSSPERSSPNTRLVRAVPPLVARAVMSRLRSSQCRQHLPGRVPRRHRHNPLHHQSRPHRPGNPGGNSPQLSRRSSPR